MDVKNLPPLPWSINGGIVCDAHGREFCHVSYSTATQQTQIAGFIATSCNNYAMLLEVISDISDVVRDYVLPEGMTSDAFAEKVIGLVDSDAGHRACALLRDESGEFYPNSIGDALVDVIASNSGDHSTKEMRRLLEMEQAELLTEFGKHFPEAVDICSRLRRRDYENNQIEMLIRAYHKNARGSDGP